MPEPPRSPRALYPRWPHDDTVEDSAHIVVQRFARALEKHIATSSASAIARKSGVPVTTVSDIGLGATRPSGLPIAKLENGVGRHLQRVKGTQKPIHLAFPSNSRTRQFVVPTSGTPEGSVLKAQALAV